MPQTSVVLVELTPADAARYNDFLRAGTRLHPASLRIAPEDVDGAPFSTDGGPEAWTLAAVGDDGRWLGIGTLERDRGRLKRRHIAWIVRMLVSEPGRGIGRALLRALKERARELPGVEKLNLTVAADNAPAVRLYASEGFVEFSRETDAFRVQDQAVTELSMSYCWKAR